MSWKSALTLCICFFAILSTGCGDNTSENNNDNNTPITFEEYAKQAPTILVESMCDSVFSCPEKQSLETMLVVGRFKNKADCVAQLPGQIWGQQELLATERKSIAAGRTEFNAEQAKKCIATVKNNSTQCNSFDYLLTNPPAECEAIFTPKIEENAPCASNNECITNNCVHGNQNECFGRCAPAIVPIKEGQECNITGCEPGLHCIAKSTTDDQHICIKEGSRKLGERCSNSQHVCEGNLTCNSKDVCAERPPILKNGESCEVTKTICAPGLACTNLKADATGTCAPPKSIDDPCINAIECQVDLYCTGTAAAPGKCATKKNAGEACTKSNQCQPTLSCDFDATKTCIAEKKDDKTCEIPTK